ncbi:terminase large subunit domain-containing protein [Streptomyces sp. AK08-02]|uniref:terminase large subunit domain-containing protein n=1 Tax=Streptomyces sp. AK08-02 TaxID=3028654 RepID=UPI0029A4C611|nr:terminase family protein [Streptomyces sp. AK08-02]MDX3749579.1 terminase family protein [Streptomyces sp. AK08-02]
MTGRPAGLPDPAGISDAHLHAEITALLEADAHSARRWSCDRPDCDGLPHEGWLHHHARAAQRVPPSEWTAWMMLTGRGWGKTFTAAQAVREWSSKPGTLIAVVAKNATLVKEICFESPKSGLLSVIPPEDIRRYSPGNGLTILRLKNGSAIYGFGAETPDNLRGFAFDKGWLDEYAAWNRHTAQSVYDMLWFCLREAPAPQVVISTTPKPLPHVKRLVERGRRPNSSVVLTTGRTEDNRANLSDAALAELDSEYGGTRLGSQELDGVLLEDVEGALWKQWMFEVEGFRVARHAVPPLERLVVAVDPAVTTTDSADFTAFTVAGRSYPLEQMYGDRRPRGYVLHAEQDRYTPTAAMRRAAALYHEHQADCVVIEANNGGEYLPALLTEVDPTVQWRIVHATRNKRARAAPVAMLYEQSRISHAGSPRAFATLEEQMTTYVGASEHEEKSPDLLDSCVWALTDLFLDVSVPGSPTRPADGRLDGRR